ncbi:cyanophycin synthetase [Granulosicoccus antarcticus]|uniref:Cyanophycin synthetase n=1 Tax=Granulosicoccus antarcticus IMCC3135 TaxID=1192854 RepID=A0A2Z2NX32_9GAMM|nr:cyanophycin synthetase [Granulosicoccus antarcticus]ASJ71714.1 Cyanophycin synthetase [Granulosicoccus antarcticus IMCC3135]
MKSLKTLIYSWISQKYMAGCSNYNSLQVRKASRSKKQARAMFARHDIPHAKGTLFLNPWTAHRFAREHGFPLCIKPNVSGFSRGSHFPINNYRELWKAALMVKVWWPTSIVEQYLLGNNYRVLATGDAMVSVIRRYPPFVDGNGQDTISTLIDAENQIREDMGLYPTVHPIQKSQATIDFLRKQGKTLNSIPAEGERVHTFNRIALAPGGVIEVIDQATIPAANRDLFLKVISAFDANLFGIDVIFEEGIEKDYREQRCIFLEVNSRPYTRMHNAPRYGQRENLDDFYNQMDALIVTDSDTF